MMAVQDFQRLQVPQDATFTLPNGTISPAWHRYLMQFSAVVNTLVDLKLVDLSGAVSGNSSAIEVLQSHFGKPSVSDVAVDALTISSTFQQAEIQALESRIRDYGAAINAINDRLRQATVVGI